MIRSGEQAIWEAKMHRALTQRQTPGWDRLVADFEKVRNQYAIAMKQLGIGLARAFESIERHQRRSRR